MSRDDGPRWAFLVEGHGEVAAVPNLVRAWFPSVTIAPPIRVSRDLMLRGDVELARYAALARQRGDAVVVLVDSDDDDPVELASNLARRVATFCPDRPVRACVAVREFEAWFLAAASALGLGEDEPSAEAVRDAKGAVRARDLRYRPFTHQPRYAARLGAAYRSLTDAQIAPSLRAFHEALASLLGSAAGR